MMMAIFYLQGLSHSKYYTRPCTLGQLNATTSTRVLDIINTSITSRRCVSSKLLSKE